MNPGQSSAPTPGSGIFISFEGIDGAGKSTHIAALAKTFEQAGYTPCTTREPGGTPLAESLRTLSLYQNMEPLTEALLMFAGRNEHIQQVILPALSKGQVVLCDRFSDASFAYQGAGRGFSWAVLQTLEQWVQHSLLQPPHAQMPLSLSDEQQEQQQTQNTLLQPQLTLWFDLAPELAAKRLQTTQHKDRFEAQDIAFFTRVRQGYAKRMQAHPQRFVRIDTAQTPRAVYQAVLQATVARGLLPPAVLEQNTTNTPDHSDTPDDAI